MDETVRYMLTSGSNRLTLRFPGISTVGARHIMHQALTVVKHYCEQGYNAANCTADKDGSLQLTFYAAGVEGSPEPQRTAALEAAKAVHDQLWASGTITANMSEYEKAMIYYIWICANCTYDQNATDNSLSHLPYQLFERGLAVCDGYTGAYNLLLKLEGISCGVVLQGDHIWTSAVLDGTEVHIDATWGDQDDRGIDNTYFAMAPEDSLRLHQT
jgi:transglutaminase/protease-like cytokinesis protein 3